jgi:hypothetical protein
VRFWMACCMFQDLLPRQPSLLSVSQTWLFGNDFEWILIGFVPMGFSTSRATIPWIAHPRPACPLFPESLWPIPPRFSAHVPLGTYCTKFTFVESYFASSVLPLPGLGLPLPGLGLHHVENATISETRHSVSSVGWLFPASYPIQYDVHHPKTRTQHLMGRLKTDSSCSGPDLTWFSRPAFVSMNSARSRNSDWLISSAAKFSILSQIWIELILLSRKPCQISIKPTFARTRSLPIVWWIETCL